MTAARSITSQGVTYKLKPSADITTRPADEQSLESRLWLLHNTCAKGYSRAAPQRLPPLEIKVMPGRDKLFKSLADAKRRVMQGVSIDFTHLSLPTLSGPTRVIMWDRTGFAIPNRLRETDGGFYVEWPTRAQDFDPKTGTIFQDGQPRIIIQLRD